MIPLNFRQLRYGLNCLINYRDWYDGFEMLWINRQENSRDFLLPTFQRVDNSDTEKCVTKPPTLEFDRQVAQDMMNDLWTAGIRPSIVVGSEGQLGATERHLADMRKLVFKDKA